MFFFLFYNITDKEHKIFIKYKQQFYFTNHSITRFCDVTGGRHHKPS